MHSILVIVEMPSDNKTKEDSLAWSSALQELRTVAENNKAVEDFGGNTWLIRAEGGLPFLTHLLSATEREKQRCRLLFFEDEPKWVRSYQPD